MTDRYGSDILSRNPHTPKLTRSTEQPAEKGLVVEDAQSGYVGAVVRVEGGRVELEDRRGKVRTFPMGPGFLIDWAKQRWDWEKRGKHERASDSADGFHNAVIETAFRAALPRYEMIVRNGRTVLFRPPLDLRWKVTGGRWVSSAREYVFPDNDLTRFAPALKVIEVPGDHDSMVLEPNVRVLAKRLKSVIAEAETLPEPLAQAAE